VNGPLIFKTRALQDRPGLSYASSADDSTSRAVCDGVVMSCGCCDAAPEATQWGKE